MAENLVAARNGEATVIADGIALHSKYAPSAEADRFIESNPFPPNTATVVLIEPALEYLADALRRRRPDVRVLCVHCSPFFKGSERSLIEPERRFYGDAEGPELDDFLGRWISDFEAARTGVLQWRPSLNAYGQRALALLERVSAYLNRAAANARTTAGFGRRWVRNTLSFAQDIRSVYVPERGNCPVVLAASGPGLEDALGEIRSARARGPLYVIAVSSAVESLLAGGVRPDLTVWIDGGQWAAFHLTAALRSGLRLSASCSAIHPSSVYDHPILVLRDESRLQAVIADALGIPAFAFPQRGTVSATALDLAGALSAGPVYLAGFDMQVLRRTTHARPNALDRFVEDEASRLAPAATGYYARYLSARDGPALRIYGQWFARRLERESGRIFVLGSGEAFPALRAVSRIEPVKESAPPILAVRTLPGTEDRRELSKRVLEAAEAALDAEMVRAGSGAMPIAEGLWSELAGQLIPESYALALDEARRDLLAPESIRRIDGALRSELRNIAEKGAR